MFLFDVSKQSEKLKTSVIDVQIKAMFNEAVPAGTQAYYLGGKGGFAVPECCKRLWPRNDI